MAQPMCIVEELCLVGISRESPTEIGVERARDGIYDVRLDSRSGECRKCYKSLFPKIANVKRPLPIAKSIRKFEAL